MTVIRDGRKTKAFSLRTAQKMPFFIMSDNKVSGFSKKNLGHLKIS